MSVGTTFDGLSVLENKWDMEGTSTSSRISSSPTCVPSRIMTSLNRIRMTETYEYHDSSQCPLELCERRYCTAHRILWRDCETAVYGIEGNRDVINGTRTIIELSDDC